MAYVDRFVMGLVWHNCFIRPPTEPFNDDLICTNGAYVFNMTWDKDRGYFIAVNGGNDYRIQEALLKDWWWADIQQTVQGEPRFKNLIINDLV